MSTQLHQGSQIIKIRYSIAINYWLDTLSYLCGHISPSPSPLISKNKTNHFIFSSYRTFRDISEDLKSSVDWRDFCSDFSGKFNLELSSVQLWPSVLLALPSMQSPGKEVEASWSSIQKARTRESLLYRLLWSTAFELRNVVCSLNCCYDGLKVFHLYTGNHGLKFSHFAYLYYYNMYL